MGCELTGLEALPVGRGGGASDHRSTSPSPNPPPSGEEHELFGHRFLLGLAWRLGLLVAAAFAFAAALGRPDLGAARVVAGLLVLGAAALLWRHVQRTNMELSRFIDAVRFGDFSQGFSHRGQGSRLRASFPARSTRRSGGCATSATN